MASITWLRFLGKISYSLYLWHWPIIVFFSWSSLQTTISLLVISTISGITLENWKNKMKKCWKGYMLALISIPTIILISILLTPAPYTPQAQIIPIYEGDQVLYRNNIVKNSTNINIWNELIPDTDVLRLDIVPSPPDNFGIDSDMLIYLTGDSHAEEHISSAVVKVTEHLNSTGINSCRKGCAFPANAWYDHKIKTWCKTFRDNELVEMRKLKPSLVFATNCEEGYNDETIDDYLTIMLDMGSKIAEWGGRLILLQDNIPMDYTIDSLKKGQQLISEPHVKQQAYSNFYNNENMTFITTRDLFCYDNKCPLIVNNIITLRDDDHLSATYQPHLTSAYIQLILETI